MQMNYVFTLDSVFKWVPPKTQNWHDKPVCFTHANVLISYVNETVFAYKPAFLEDSCQSFYGQGQLTLCQCYLKMHVVCDGPGASLWVLRHFLSLISRLIVAVWIFPVAQTVKNLPAMQETWVRSLGWKDHLEKGIAIHSSILAWRIPWTEEPGKPQSMWSQRVVHNWPTNTATTSSYITSA